MLELNLCLAGQASRQREPQRKSSVQYKKQHLTPRPGSPWHTTTGTALSCSNEAHAHSQAPVLCPATSFWLSSSAQRPCSTALGSLTAEKSLQVTPKSSETASVNGMCSCNVTFSSQSPEGTDLTWCMTCRPHWNSLFSTLHFPSSVMVWYGLYIGVLKGRGQQWAVGRLEERRITPVCESSMRASATTRHSTAPLQQTHPELAHPALKCAPLWTTRRISSLHLKNRSPKAAHTFIGTANCILVKGRISFLSQTKLWAAEKAIPWKVHYRPSKN